MSFRQNLHKITLIMILKNFRVIEREYGMYYELYIDSLFLINFVMNLYLLEVVNITLMRTATRKRVIAGAAFGALSYLLPFLWSGPIWLKLSLGAAIGTIGMIGITFRTKSIKGFLKVLERLVLFTFLFGGVLLFIIKSFPSGRIYLTNIFGVLGLGALIFMGVSYFLGKKKQAQDIYKVLIIGKGAQMSIHALLDTGNGLIEPISGKPVCILERNIFENLWKDNKPGGFRMIPFHSIGKSNGVLPGYIIPEIQIEIDGIVKSCKNIYVAVGEEKLSASGSYKMILNPSLLEQKEN